MSKRHRNRRINQELSVMFQSNISHKFLTENPLITDNVKSVYKSSESVINPVNEFGLDSDNDRADIFNSKNNIFESNMAEIFCDPNTPETADNNMRNMTLSDELLSFYVSFNIPKRAMTHLIEVLNRHGVADVPKSRYLLKKSVKTYPLEIMRMETDNYAYLGIRENLSYLFENGIVNLLGANDISLDVKIYGPC